MISHQLVNNLSPPFKCNELAARYVSVSECLMRFRARYRARDIDAFGGIASVRVRERLLSLSNDKL